MLTLVTIVPIFTLMFFVLGVLKAEKYMVTEAIPVAFVFAVISLLLNIADYMLIMHEINAVVTILVSLISFVMGLLSYVYIIRHL